MNKMFLTAAAITVGGLWFVGCADERASGSKDLRPDNSASISQSPWDESVIDLNDDMSAQPAGSTVTPAPATNPSR